MTITIILYSIPYDLNFDYSNSNILFFSFEIFSQLSISLIVISRLTRDIVFNRSFLNNSFYILNTS